MEPENTEATNDKPKRKKKTQGPAETPATSGAAATGLAAGADAQAATPAEPLQPPVNTESKRTLKEWAALDGIMIVTPSGFDSADPELWSKLFTKAEYLQGKLGSVTQPGASPKAEPAAYKPTINDEYIMRLEKARAIHRDEVVKHEELKNQTNKAAGDVKKAADIIFKIIDEASASDSQPGLYDHVDAKGAIMPRRSSKPADEPTRTAKDGTVVPDSAWRSVVLDDLGLTKILTKRLHEKFASMRIPPVANVGDIVDAIIAAKAGTILTAEGVSEAEAKKIDKALAGLWDKLGIKSPLAAEDASPADEAQPNVTDPITVAGRQLGRDIADRFETVGIKSEVVNGEIGMQMTNTVIATIVDDTRKGVPISDLFSDPKLTVDDVLGWVKAANELDDKSYLDVAKTFGYDTPVSPTA